MTVDRMKSAVPLDDHIRAQLATAHAIEDRRVGWLVAEFCSHALFNGWHLYLRDTDRHQRNADGSWGWLRGDSHLRQLAHTVLADLGIAMRPGGDGSCDNDGYAELARRFPIRGRRRGGIMVVRDERGGWTARHARSGARHVAAAHAAPHAPAAPPAIVALRRHLATQHEVTMVQHARAEMRPHKRSPATTTVGRPVTRRKP